MCLVREQGNDTRGAHPTTNKAARHPELFNDPAHKHAGSSRSITWIKPALFLRIHVNAIERCDGDVSGYLPPNNSPRLAVEPALEAGRGHICVS